MTLLILGILVWSLIHFYPAIAPDSRRALIARMGTPLYRGIFALIVIGAMLLIIFGWKAVPPELVYVPPTWGPYVTVAFMLAAFILIFAPFIENSISGRLRHPQMLGAVLWGVGHLLSNGELRSLVLFGGMALWAALEILLLNRRDGAWKKPDRPVPTANLRLLLTALGFFAMVMYLHTWLFGVGALAYF